VKTGKEARESLSISAVIQTQVQMTLERLHTTTLQ